MPFGQIGKFEFYSSANSFLNKTRPILETLDFNSSPGTGRDLVLHLQRDNFTRILDLEAFRTRVIIEFEIFTHSQPLDSRYHGALQLLRDFSLNRLPSRDDKYFITGFIELKHEPASV